LRSGIGRHAAADDQVIVRVFHDAHTRTTFTSTLPRIAFEYGQICVCALSINDCATARSTPGIDTFSSTAMPKPFGIGPMLTALSIEVSAGTATLACVPAYF